MLVRLRVGSLPFSNFTHFLVISFLFKASLLTYVLVTIANVPMIPDPQIQLWSAGVHIAT